MMTVPNLIGSYLAGAACLWPRIFLPSGDIMDFCWIPAGEFMMGSINGENWEQPRHRVVIEEGFWMQSTPVTQAQFRACPDFAEHDFYFKNKPDHPAENVSWKDATVYADWMNGDQREQLPDGYSVGLPSEAYWEYACRAGSETEFSSGAGAGALDQVARYDQDLETGTRSVLEGVSNAFGVSDMHGNVWEWCSDVWDAHAYAKRGDGWRAGSWTELDAGSDVETLGEGSVNRVVRGGSFNNPAIHCRSACRFGGWPDNRGWNRGLRLALLPVSGGHQPSQEAEVAGRPASERGTSRAAGRTDTGAGAVDLSSENF